MESAMYLGRARGITISPDETARALFRRKNGRPFDLGLPILNSCGARAGRAPGVYPGELIEVHGESGAGKTEVLLRMVACAVLPATAAAAGSGSGSRFGSASSPLPPAATPATSAAACAAPRDVFYFDHDGRLDLERLEAVLRGRLRETHAGTVREGRPSSPSPPPRPRTEPTPEPTPEPTLESALEPTLESTPEPTPEPTLEPTLESALEPTLESALESALGRVSVVQCGSPLEFAAALEVLYHHLRGREALVVVDSCGAFHWGGKLTELCCQGEGATFAHPACRALGRLCAERCVVVAAAKPTLFRHRGGASSSSSSSSLEHREYMPSAWQQLVAVRLNLVKRGAFTRTEHRRCRPPHPAPAPGTGAACADATPAAATTTMTTTVFEMWASKGASTEISATGHSRPTPTFFCIEDHGISVVSS